MEAREKAPALAIKRFDWASGEDVGFECDPAWAVAVYEPRFDHESACAWCGKAIGNADAYPSGTLHTPCGFPIRVCLRCLANEIEERAGAVDPCR